MNWTDKIWGKVRDIEDYHNRFENGPKKKRTLLQVEKGCCSSVHYHDTWNEFIVVTGIIKIVYLFGDQIHGVNLGQGEMFTVPAFVPHQFQVLESGLLVELYGTQEPSIFRLSKGKAGLSVYQGVFECL